MQTEVIRERRCVRADYRILFRADAEIVVPEQKGRMRTCLQAIFRTFSEWAGSGEGEPVRQAYLALPEIRDRSRFRTVEYRLRGKFVWEGEGLVSWVAETQLRDANRQREEIRRTAIVWNTEEETALPPREIFRLAGLSARERSKQLPFRPDGIYPVSGSLVCFRNGRGADAFREIRLPCKL